MISLGDIWEWCISILNGIWEGWIAIPIKYKYVLVILLFIILLTFFKIINALSMFILFLLVLAYFKVKWDALL